MRTNKEEKTEFVQQLIIVLYKKDDEAGVPASETGKSAIARVQINSVLWDDDGTERLL